MLNAQEKAAALATQVAAAASLDLDDPAEVLLGGVGLDDLSRCALRASRVPPSVRTRDFASRRSRVELFLSRGVRCALRAFSLISFAA